MKFTTEAMLTSPAGFGLETASPLQRACCRVLDGLPLGDLAARDDVRTALGGTTELVGGRPAEVVILAGIRTAKSMTAGACAIVRALTCDVAHLAPGELPRVVVCSLSLDLAEVVFRHIVGTIEARPALRKLLVEPPTSDAVLLKHPSGRPVEIKVVALARAGASLVARWLVAVIFDEAPRMVGADDGVRNLSDARTAAIGRLLPGGQLITIGSPWAPFGPVYELVQEHWGKPSERIVVVRGTGPAMNPVWWTPARCERLRASDPTAHRTDVLGEFTDPESALLSTVELDRATRAAPLELPYELEHHYVAAMDPGTRGNAWTLVLAVGKRGAELLSPDRHVVVLCRQWRGSKAAPLSPDVVLKAIAATLKPYGVDVVLTDQYSADALRDLAHRHGLYLQVVPITAPLKVELYEALRMKFANGDVELPPDPVLREDLLSVRKRVTQNGVMFELPRTSDGRHADYAAALALTFARPPLPPPLPPADPAREGDEIERLLCEEARRQEDAVWWDQ